MTRDLRAEDPASVGPYRLLGRLGAGGMGQVYLGRSPGGRLVAIKLIRPELAEERGFRARFASEITAAKHVSGIYTAAVVDADADAELPWMATVYVAGPSLTDAVEENGPLPVTSVLALAGGLAEALAAIHRAGLVHRDLKPSNVLLAADGPRVIDFGISLALERSMLTTTGMVLGSPGFMSPEQARGQRDVGAPTDVFSLGAVLAYAATGNNPFGGGPTPALLYRVVNEMPDLAAVPARLGPLIERCLAKNPADRPTPAGILALVGDDAGLLSGDWLPPSVTQTMVRYTPTSHTPVPPALREPERTPRSQAAPAPQSIAPAPPGPAGYEPTALGAVVPAPAPSAPSGPAGYEPTALGAVVPAPVPATWAERGAPPETAVAATPGAATAVGYGTRGGPDGPGGGFGGPSGPLPPTRQPPRRRWLWPSVLAAAAVIVVVVVAVLLTTHSGGGTPSVRPTASLAGNTKSPGTRPTTAPPSATPTAATSAATPARTSPAAAPTTSAPTTSAPTTSAPTTSVPTTSAPTTTAPTSSAPTTSAPTTSAPTTSAPAQNAPTTPTQGTSSSSPAAPATSAPASAAQTTPASPGTPAT